MYSERHADWRVAQETVLKSVKQMSPKTCVLDPIPTSLFECSGQVFPLRTCKPVLTDRHLSFLYENSHRQTPLAKPSLGPNVFKNILDMFQICPLCPNPSRKLSLTNISVIWIKAIFGTRSQHNGVQRELSFVFSMTS